MGRRAHDVMFGLSEENVKRLTMDKPIMVRGRDLGLPRPGCDFLIVHGTNERSVARIFDMIANRLNGSGAIMPVHSIHGSYVMTVTGGKRRQLGVIGLTNDAMAALRSHTQLSLRVGVESGLMVDVLIFYGDTEFDMMNTVVRVSERDEPMTAEHLKSVLAFYQKHLGESGHYSPIQKPDDMPFLERYGSLNHCLWMCGQALDMIERKDVDKAMRWLGFIQGAMWSFGVFTIEQMREHSRPPEKGGKLS